MRREETETVKVVMRINIEERRGRPKKGWLDTKAAIVCIGVVED